MRAEGQGLRGARRVLVYGVTCSGKTALAERLSRLVGMVSVDDLTWQAGWVPVPEARNLDHRHVCNGNVESWRQTFSRDSIVVWHFRAFTRKHERIARWEAVPAMPPVLRIRTPDELETWLSSIAHEIREAA